MTQLHRAEKGAETTSFDGTKSIPRPQRKLYVASLLAAFAVTVAFSFVSGGIDRFFVRMEVREFPYQLELVVWLSRILRDPVWLGVVFLAVVFLVLVALKGLLDRVLKLLIGLNVAWLAVFVVASLLSYAAFFKLLEALRVP